MSAEIETKLTEATSEMKTFVQKASEEMKNLGQVQAETKQAMDSLKTQIDQLRAEMLRPTPGGTKPEEQKSIGQRLIESDSVKHFAANWHKGAAGLDFEGLFERKTTITSTAVGSSTPGILVPERVGGIIKPPMRRIRVRDLIPWGTTTNNAVEFVKENVFTNAASPQTEGSDKGESALTFTIDYANVQTIAHWIPASRQVLDDFAQLQAYVDQRLLDGLADIEDYELLRGVGTGVHIKGLVVHATAVAGTYATAGDTYIDQINNAITELEDNEYVADGVVVHPADWRKMQKVKDETGGTNKGLYVLGGPAANAEARLWDLPIVRTTAMPKGKFLVAQFAGSVQGYDRMKSQVAVSTEHSDYFIKNLVAIRAEQRVAMACFRPAAFRYGTFS